MDRKRPGLVPGVFGWGDDLEIGWDTATGSSSRGGTAWRLFGQEGRWLVDKLDCGPESETLEFAESLCGTVHGSGFRRLRLRGIQKIA